LEHVITIDVDEINDFFTVRSDGSFDAKPMLIHLLMFMAFVLYYIRKRRELLTLLTEDDVLKITKTEFKAYCGSVENVTDVATVSSPPKMSANPRLDANAVGVVGTITS
jgi:hypothetical protein